MLVLGLCRSTQVELVRLVMRMVLITCHSSATSICCFYWFIFIFITKYFFHIYTALFLDTLWLNPF